MDTDKYKKLFLQEASERLKTINSGILNLAKGVEQDSNIDDLFRCFHSVKGMAASMGYELVKSLTHRLEGLLDALRKKTMNVNPAIIDTLLKGADMIDACLKNLSEDRPLDMDLKPLFDEIEKHLAVGKDSLRTSEEKPVESRAPQPASMPGISLSNTIKVEAEVFDNAIADIGELLRIKSRINEITKNTELSEDVRLLDKSIAGLYETIVSARTIPLDELTQNLPRIVYDISRNRGKEVELSMQGIDIRVDRAVLDAAAEPLVHIIRNAIDHGIEMPEERKKLGKPQKGQIKISAVRERNDVVIEMIDDGRGIDPEKVKEKAAALGMSKEKIDGMTSDESLSLICLPGLSLAKVVTDVSGRGVGMDVVKKNIEAIGGTLTMKSEINKGARFILRLPLTTSIIKILKVSLNNRLFCLPLSKVESIAEIQKSEIENTDSGISFLYRDMEVPIFDLRKVFNMPFKEIRDVLIIVVMDVRGKTVGFLVDEFKGVVDAYIKPLPKILQDMKGVSGFTIMGNGSPVFLIDAANII